MVKREVLVIKCKTKDIPIAFRVLATKLDVDHEETLKRLLKLEQDHPLNKVPRGSTTRL